MTILDTLRQFPAFSDVPNEQLQWLADHADEQTYPADTVIYKAGDAIDHLMLLIDGRVRLDTGPDSAPDEIAVYTSHSILGVLPFSRLTKASVRITAEKPTYTLLLHRKQFREMAQVGYELTGAFVQQMTTRVRDFTKQTQQEDKMASLGRLSAGLAHELNNPVAAVVRSADTLKEHLRATPEAFKAIMHLSLTNQQVDSVNDAFFKKVDQKAPALTMMQRSSLEDELTDWLDDHGVDDAVDLAGPLVEFGFKTDDLDWILNQVGDANMPRIVNWLVNNLVTEKLVMDISEASKRISTLVGSIKNYTHMDRGAGKEQVHLPDGLHSTLTLLDYKLKSKHITISLDLPADLPAICGWPGELNQVWTNLIDNAIDAMPDSGQLTIRSYVDRGEFVLTTITDNGSGIPADIQDKIFEPFFTTKEIGKGTGLGLDIVQGIIKHHNGSIKLKSKPGETEFSVCLPIL
ncbi:sensor histidine kinase [Spirosoma montaniterrae]|uniref:histidine kinase n=1 Tax=Spirosoma montaniterrae TaxID=1178516 RepID=A0A1P9WZS3_9BACT|nr:ATP-binding protein [Spirosoma montaniterrae]AQG80838.1 histidine kinase [Spirosoma montaniterrae]